MSGIADLEAAVAKASDSLNAKMALAGAYLASGELDVALAFSKWWQNDRPLDVESHLLEADVLRTQQKYAQAAQAVSAAAEIDATNTLVQLASIKLDIISENYTQGLRKVETLLGQEPNNVKALANYFKIQNELGNPERAFNKIESAAQNDVKNEALTILFASTLISNQQYTRALEVLDSVDADRLTLPTFWDIKASALFNTENLVEAESHYKKWVSFFPNEAGPTLGLLSVLDLQRKYTEAVTVATAYLANQDDFQVRMMAAHFFAASNDAKGAQGILNTIRPQYLDLPYLRGVKAQIALLEGRGMEAVDDAESAYFAQKTSDNLRMYARTLDSAGQTQLVLPLVQSHMSEFPNDARSKVLLAERTIASNPAQALSYYEELLTQFPDSPALLNNAAYLHFEAGNMEKALEYSTEAYTFDPRNTAFADTYAQVLLYLGETEKAVEAYSLVVNDNLRDEDVIINYIETLLKNDNTLAATRRIQQFSSSVKTQQGKQRLFNLQVEYLN
jgi:putative PEP-CTERM system TPR-repeat lipoprotein